MKPKPTIVARRKIASGRIFRIEETDLLYSNGVERTHEFAVARAERAVLIVPMLNEETILLIREYSVGVDRYELGFPKGALEADEPYLEGAQRELKEEVGYGATQLTFLKEVTAIPGYLTGSMYCILAQGLYPEKLEGDEPEPLDVIPWKLSQINDLVAQEDFTEARSIAALFMTMHYLNNAS